MPRYWSCPACDTFYSEQRTKPVLVFLDARLVGICSDCAKALNNSDLKQHVGFGKKVRPTDELDSCVSNIFLTEDSES